MWNSSAHKYPTCNFWRLEKKGSKVVFLEKVKRPHSNGERLSKTTHMRWLKKYCSSSLECYSSLRTHGSWTFILWPFASAKHFPVSHISGLPVDFLIKHMWKIDIIHLWASWSSCFLTSDLIMYFFFLSFTTSILLEICVNMCDPRQRGVDNGIQSVFDRLSILTMNYFTSTFGAALEIYHFLN